MRLPIRNKSDRPLTVFIEPFCDQFEVPAGGEAIVRLEKPPHSIDLDVAWVTIWDEGDGATVEVISAEDKRVDDALMLARGWLHRFGAEREAKLIGRAVDDLEPLSGYFSAREEVFRAFYDGLASEEEGGSTKPRPQHGIIRMCFQAGVRAAQLNRAARENRTFLEIDAEAPLDTATVRLAFERALAKSG